MKIKPKDVGQGFLTTIIAAAVIAGTVLMIHERFNTDEVNTDEATPEVESVMEDLSVIRIAAERNGIEYGSDNWFILLAIRKAENGPAGREFGIMNPEANDLDSQAGWCAASIWWAKVRWNEAGKPGDFITFMGARYCPPKEHTLNKNWVKNVTYWKNKLKIIKK